LQFHQNRIEQKNKDSNSEEINAREHINLHNSCYKEDISPIDSSCRCQTCKVYSRSYLHHLLKAKEMLGHVAITTHNIHTMNRLMQEIRNALKECATLSSDAPFFELMNEWI
jgi:queuine tRNA-ribosyltransferase